MELKVDKKLYLCMSALVVMAILLCNTNNNPNSFILRVLPPYEKDSSKLFYANVIILVLIPFILFDLYKATEWKMINSVPKRLVCMIVFMLLSVNVGNQVVQLYKSFQKDLNAIYLDRDHMEVSYNWTTKQDDKGKYITHYSGEAYITLKNCSNKVEQRFKVQLVIDDQFKERENPIIEKSLNGQEIFYLRPGETKKIQVFSIDESQTGQNYGSGGWNGGIARVILFNQNDHVVFSERY